MDLANERGELMWCDAMQSVDALLQMRPDYERTEYLSELLCNSSDAAQADALHAYAKSHQPPEA
jgi:hypothetical protein